MVFPIDMPSGMHLVYLPDFNPVEEGFSLMKAWLKRNCDFTLSKFPNGLLTSMDPFVMLWDAIYQTLTPQNIHGWYSNCGYVV